MWFDDQFEKTFRRLSDRFFNSGDVFEYPFGGQVQSYGPYYYGYEMTVGPDGKPHVREWGNTKPTTALTETGTREPYVDETINEKEQLLKLVTEMPGIEKSDISVNIADNTVSISATRGDRKYSAKVPLKYKVDENSAKAKYTNGILELTLKLAEEKPKGKVVSVE
ncbi:Hsp20 family protein [Nitrosopumilus sp. K4]|uniref:archaeal heat shock protein Hsp20 n=1 Tax=Nitrosopumilus sp. K4 TaxID=2795383 RepID=UPI001BA9C265|nr:archaeal heat shock protein Hsp20 [Nitrosopumilus sp. K4]QUC65582.1 Hsp20 family protein [Nitrosopumilus sp. K4]